MKVKVMDCIDPMMWYCDSIGESFELIKECKNESCYLIVDCHGYSNIILYSDGELISDDII